MKQQIKTCLAAAGIILTLVFALSGCGSRHEKVDQTQTQIEEPTVVPTPEPSPESTEEPTTEPSTDPLTVPSPTPTAPTPIPSDTPTPIPVDTPTPVAEDLVIDAYSSDDDPAWQAKYGDKSDASFHIPKICLPGDEIEHINQEIYEENYKLAMREYYDGVLCYKYVKYSWTVEGDILSLIIEGYENYPAPGSYDKAYVFSISHAREATRDEILAARGISEEEYFQKLREALGSYYLEWWNGQGVPQDSFYWGQFEKTVSEDNLTAASPYFNGEGHLMASARMYSLVAADYYQESFDLDDYALSPDYADAMKAIGKPVNSTETAEKTDSQTAASFADAINATMDRIGYDLFSDKEKKACRGDLFELNGEKALCLFYEVPAGAKIEKGSYVELWIERDGMIHCLTNALIENSGDDNVTYCSASIITIEGSAYLNTYLRMVSSEDIDQDRYYLIGDELILSYDLYSQETVTSSQGGTLTHDEDSAYYSINKEPLDRDAFYSTRDRLRRTNVLTLYPYYSAEGTPPQGKTFEELSAHFASLKETENKEDTTIALGAGNLANGGCATGDERYTFYVNRLVLYNIEYELIREDNETGASKQIFNSSHPIKRLNLAGDSLYFVCDHAIMRYSSIYERVETAYQSEKGISGLTAYQDYLYFSEGTDLVKINLDGSGRTVVLEGQHIRSGYCIVDDRIYYSTGNYQAKGNLYSMDLDGGDMVQLTSGENYGEIYFSDGEWLYLDGFGNTDSKAIYRCRLDGSEPTILSMPKNMEMFSGFAYNCIDDTIYVLGCNDGMYMLKDSQDWVRIRNTKGDELFLSGESICIVGDWVYFTVGSATWRMMLDGSSETALYRPKF